MTAFALPRHYHRALHAVAVLVPAEAREDWRRLWHAELWHATHQGRGRNVARAFDLTVGLVSDAAWLRIEGLRLRFSGSPALCLSMLTLLCIVAAVFAFRLSGLETGQLFLSDLARQFRERFLCAAVIALVAQFGLPREGRAPAPARARAWPQSAS